MSRPVAGKATLTSARSLPLEAVVEATPTGWNVRLPLRVEVVTITKQLAQREQVRVWRRQTEHVETIEATTRSERLRRDDVPHDRGETAPSP